jgi:hypothetical protein
MRRALRRLGQGALLGAAIGALARLLMRLVALDTEAEPELTWGASSAILLLFVVSCAGGATAVSFAHHRWLGLLTVVVTSFPIYLMGSAIGIVEVAAALDDEGIAGLRRVGVLVLAAAILGLAYGTPYLGWRLASRTGPRAQPSAA